MPLDIIKQHPVSLKEALAARSVVYSRMIPTQLLRCAGLADAIGADIHVKYENHNPTNSFKIRGGINLMHHLGTAGVKGVITFSTGTGYELPFCIYQDRLSDFVLLTEDEIYQSIALAGYHTRNLVEGAGAATIMAAWKLRERLQGKRVVLQFSGGNAAPDELRIAYALEAFATGVLPEAI